jgi:hypothetical protein
MEASAPLRTKNKPALISCCLQALSVIPQLPHFLLQSLHTVNYAHLSLPEYGLRIQAQRLPDVARLYSCQKHLQTLNPACKPHAASLAHVEQA